MSLFNKTIAELVHLELVKQNIKLIDLAKKLNMDERTIRYFNEANTSRHYKLKDLYRIARILKIDITELIPNEKSLKKIRRNYSDKQIRNLLTKILDSLEQ